MAVNTNTDWAAFYTEVLDQVDIPATSREDYSSTSITVRNLLVQLNDIYAAALQKGLEASIVSVYADVVHISGTIILTNPAGLLISARRIEVDPGAQIILDYRSGQVSKLVVYTHEIAGKLQVSTVTPSATNVLDLSELQTVGIMVSYKGTAPATTPLHTFDDSGLELGSPMRMSLAALFQFATAVFFSHPDIAQSILGWIVAMTNGSKAAQDLYLQSSACLAQLNVSRGSVTFVPYLDKDIYADIAVSFMPAAQAYEEQYERFSDKQHSVEDRKAAANLMLQHYRDLTSFNGQLLQHSKDSLVASQGALDHAEATFRMQQYNVQQAGIGFKYQSKIWVREQTIQAAFDICAALITFAVSIGAVAFGDPEASAKAGQSAEQAAKAAKEADEMQSLASSMKILNDVSEKLQKAYESINKVLELVRGIGDARQATDVTAPETDTISGQAEWDAFKVESDALLKPAIDKEVPGAAEYAVELDKLSIYGKAYLASKAALIKAAQEVAQLSLQKQVSANQETRLKSYIAQLTAEGADDDQMMQIFFEQELNIKRWLFIAIQNYTWAYRYWALADSSVQLSIVESVPKLQEHLGQIKQEYAKALESFDPPPAPLHVSVTIPDTDQGEFKGVIASLKQKRSASFALELAHPTFDGKGRVRLNTVRIWLEGVAASKAVPLSIDITNSGVYSDRLSGNTYRFASSALKRSFEYQGTPGDATGIILDGTPDQKQLYFQPTPFSQWTVTLRTAGADLSGVKQLTMEFLGTCIPEM
jgi:hypothetical protein